MSFESLFDVLFWFDNENKIEILMPSGKIIRYKNKMIALDKCRAFAKETPATLKGNLIVLYPYREEER